MLLEILIAGTASYGLGGQKLGPCKPINFIFGNNGSGKTSISRVIADPSSYPTCNLTWMGGREIERLVYNSDFTNRNFISKLPGIFTLGEESIETIAKIEHCLNQCDRLQDDIRKLKVVLQGGDGVTGKKIALEELRASFETQCWIIKNRHDEYFRQAFEGSRGTKAKFCDKILNESKVNAGKSCSLDDLKTRAKTVFRKDLSQHVLLDTPDAEDLKILESSSVISKRIIGKEDVNVASLIQHLGNVDWVKQGRSYLEHSAPNCPFCQQSLPVNISHQLNEYFDEVYTNDLAEIDKLRDTYDKCADVYLKKLRYILTIECEYLEKVAFTAELNRLSHCVELNKHYLRRKHSEPSESVHLEPIEQIADELKNLLQKANSAIDSHNDTVKNLANEKGSLVQDAWHYVLNEVKSSLLSYEKCRDGLEKAVAGLTGTICRKELELSELKTKLMRLERSVTSAGPAVTGINLILESFGFSNFSLATTGENNNFYKIIRRDGSDATQTLSEGEKTFLTFLYFYHLIRGSVSDSGATFDRVIVFDDPISSLDGDVLFIVSSLIKKVLDEVCAGLGCVKQVFILTHNVYFHKEVTFGRRRGKECRNHETFWIVRKHRDGSVIAGYDYNPIRTSYELLWAEVRDPMHSSMTIQNTLRRILENYFKMFGNIENNEIIEEFSGHEKQICASLFSWVNDGSHTINDDLYISPDDSLIQHYITVFREIFVRTKHLSHYEMMMGISSAATEKAAPPIHAVAA